MFYMTLFLFFIFWEFFLTWCNVSLSRMILSPPTPYSYLIFQIRIRSRTSSHSDPDPKCVKDQNQGVWFTGNFLLGEFL